MNWRTFSGIGVTNALEVMFIFGRCLLLVMPPLILLCLKWDARLVTYDELVPVVVEPVGTASLALLGFSNYENTLERYVLLRLVDMFYVCFFIDRN